MKELVMGKTSDGRTFSIPLDAVARKFAVIGVSGSGKTCTVAVMAEQMHKQGLLWIALDPVGNFWGLRSGKDGDPKGGLDIVVIGGEHGDIELRKDKGYGQRIAEAVMSENVCVAVDLSMDTKSFSRTFLTEFTDSIMEMRPDEPRHIFLEESPQFVPQHPSYPEMKRCAASIEKLVCLGRNRGYGVTLVSQRAATISKDCLTQAEQLIVMRLSHKLDRKALHEWVEAKAVEADLDDFWKSMATLKDGEGFFWSPEWLKRFERVQFDRATTFHPGETRRVGVKAKSVQLVDVRSFVEKVNRQLAKKVVAVPVAVPKVAAFPAAESGRWSSKESNLPPQPTHEELDRAKDEITRLKSENHQLRSALHLVEDRLTKVRSHLRPQYDTLKFLFEEMGTAQGTNGAVNKDAYTPWLAKAGRAGAKRFLEILIERGQLTRNQLGTLGGCAATTSTFRGYMAFLKRNGLVEVDGDNVRLLPV